MKQKKVAKKLNLGKVTVSRLNNGQLDVVKGGALTVTYNTACVTCDVYRCNPTYTSLPYPYHCVPPKD
jgi:hypothetical protein